jgi:predicted SAM-dependent methyltransferase
MRSLFSYHRVQKVIGRVLRGHRAFVRRKRYDFLQIGCGLNIAPGFVNVDRHWSRGVDACWDITKGLPYSDASFRGVFTEHCLEHIAFDECASLLREIYRVMTSGGILRVIVPDGEHIIDYYVRIRAGADLAFPLDEQEYFTFTSTPMTEVNRAFYCYGHRFMYDYETMKKLMEIAGFKSIARTAFRQGHDPALLIDSERRAGGSLFIEGVR